MMTKILIKSVNNTSNDEREVAQKFEVLGKVLLEGEAKDYKL